MNSIRLSGPDFDADGAVVSATASIAGSADGGKDESIASGVHTVYGDAVWLLALMAQSGMTDVLRQAFPGRAFRARLTLHLLHAVLRDGSGITCDNFVAKSAASWLFPDIAPSGLREDVRFFKKMGEESVRSAFFGALLAARRKSGEPPAAVSCADTVPLPAWGPMDLLRCREGDDLSWPTSLLFFLDDRTGLPLWFGIGQGSDNARLLAGICRNAACELELAPGLLLLDSEYAEEDAPDAACPGGKCGFIVPMPDRKGFPYMELCRKHAIPDSWKAAYSFVRNGRLMFGKKVPVKLFGRALKAYVYVDRHEALRGSGEFMSRHPDRAREMTGEEKDWMLVRDGYFVLLSTLNLEPREIWDAFFARTRVEAGLKKAADFSVHLPQDKWTAAAVKGKILLDCIAAHVMAEARAKASEAGMSLSELFSVLQSLMCAAESDGRVLLDTPSAAVKKCFELLGIELGSVTGVDRLKHELKLRS